MEVVRNREGEVDAPRLQREQLIKKDVDERIKWVLARASKLKVEEIMMEEVKGELEVSRSAKKVQRQITVTTKMAKGLRTHFIRVFVFYLRVRRCRLEGENPF